MYEVLNTHIVGQMPHSIGEPRSIRHQLSICISLLLQPAIVNIDVLVSGCCIPLGDQEIRHGAEQPVAKGHENENTFQKHTCWINNTVYVHKLQTVYYLIQLSGSFLQSVLHLNLSQASHPMGGVRARPFSSPRTKLTKVKAKNSLIKSAIFFVCFV